MKGLSWFVALSPVQYTCQRDTLAESSASSLLFTLSASFQTNQFNMSVTAQGVISFCCLVFFSHWIVYFKLHFHSYVASMTPSPLKHFNLCRSWLLWPDLWRNKNAVAYNTAFYGSPFLPLDHFVFKDNCNFLSYNSNVFLFLFFLSQLWVYISQFYMI